uniref:Putative voltage gated channel protein n=1 Tax=Bifidobacterium pseudocatenulatum TaxID=28026 RepID=A0A0K2JZU6_BIFPS|nr:putative voltage gated channel protein [Bifidobacterium pseudocatenulatum]
MGLIIHGVTDRGSCFVWGLVSVKPGITQPPHRRSYLALLLATEQHHQIVTGTQPCITARHDLAFAATQADDQTPRRPTHVTHPLAVRNRPHFQWQFHNAAAHMACDCHLHALRTHVPLQQLPIDRFGAQQIGHQQRDESDGSDRHAAVYRRAARSRFRRDARR